MRIHPPITQITQMGRKRVKLVMRGASVIIESGFRAVGTTYL